MAFNPGSAMSRHQSFGAAVLHQQWNWDQYSSFKDFSKRFESLTSRNHFNSQQNIIINCTPFIFSPPCCLRWWGLLSNIKTEESSISGICFKTKNYVFDLKKKRGERGSRVIKLHLLQEKTLKRRQMLTSPKSAHTPILCFLYLLSKHTLHIMCIFLSLQ